MIDDIIHLAGLFDFFLVCVGGGVTIAFLGGCVYAILAASLGFWKGRR